MKKESLWGKIKDSVKIWFVVYQLICILVSKIVGGVSWIQFLSYNGAVIMAFLGIREYGKRYRPRIDITNQND